MKTKSTLEITANNLCFTFLPSGDIYSITHKDTMINQLMSNSIDGSLNNIYLRIYQNDQIKAVPLLGIKSTSKLVNYSSHLVWEGNVEGIDYVVTFRLTDAGIWFWDVVLNGDDGQQVDVIYGQDLGMADQAAVRSNEAYMSQYMDHAVFDDKDKGFVVCTRQNQPQQSGFPYIQQGMLTKAEGYSTDGFQFFGLSYKTTNQPEILEKPTLSNAIYQYEFAYIALQSERVRLEGQQQFVFYGIYKADHPEAVSSVEYQQELTEAWTSCRETQEMSGKLIDKVHLSSIIGEPLASIGMTEAEVDNYFPDRQLEERDKGSLLSFFTNSYEHVILKKKEELVERPHGHILMSGNNNKIQDNTITTTSYMYGLFNSQLVIGNINMNKWITNARNPLNVMKTSGQRIYVKIDNQYRLLTMPSIFELGFNYARWYYKIEEDVLVITNFTTVDSSEVQLQVQSTSGKDYSYLVTNQVSMNSNEYHVSYNKEKKGNSIIYTADTGSDSDKTYPELAYRVHLLDAVFEVADERLLATHVEPGSASLEVLSVEATPEWTMVIQGMLHQEDQPVERKDAQEEAERYRAFYSKVMGNFHIAQAKGNQEEIEKVNALSWWYTHNMLVHFSVPHGLEQYGGAAWGTRDVSQGPAEYFMATQNYDTVRDIIKTIFSHQYEDTGNWPQWFMFDKYTTIQQEESHGDIIIWPLKVIGDYLEATNDFSILVEKVPYTDRKTFRFTDDVFSILDHVNKEIAYIKQHFLHDTHLSAYDDGDWDDTLQPANQQLKKYMVSTWTVALTYQTLRKMATVLTSVDKKVAIDVKRLVTGIKHDFKKYILSSEVIPGFLYMEDPEQVELMLHPTDTKTGIHYRLLPMQRSIISELLTPKQAQTHYDIIQKQLSFPDGVRLMNQPANYQGGVSTHFKRAEQASNFGREIGLQYVHAHIRFVEAMAKLGHKEDAWNGLSVINPVGIRSIVKNAEYRQSNAYFSSSDGKFSTRYDAQNNFDQLRTGSVPVKGGWRIYSSGPGIYMNQLISNVLGIRQQAGDLVIDPVLPNRFDGLTFTFVYQNRPMTFVYHLQQQKKGIKVNGDSVETTQVANLYREGGFVLSQELLEKYVTRENNQIDIYM